MKPKCHNVKSGKYNTDGSPVMIRICYCGTSGCVQLGELDSYPLPNDYNLLSKIKINETSKNNNRQKRLQRRKE